MVTYRLAYGKHGLEFDLPLEQAQVTVVEPVHIPGLADPNHELTKSLQNPISSDPLRSRILLSDRVGIVVNDITRPTPTNQLLSAIFKEVDSIPAEQITIFIATGTHRQNTTEELVSMLGERYTGAYRIVQNDARADSVFVDLGITSSGNLIRINRELVECDFRIVVGFIEPHFFAGFSGGGKTFMPGMAHLRSIMVNHSPENIDHPNARWGITKGNPIWEDIVEATRMLAPAFLVNVALNRDREIIGVFAGGIEEAHRVGTEFVKQHAMVPVERPFDVVITSNAGYPLDLNLYQSVKGMSAASQIVKPGGSIIIAAECWDGIPAEGEFGRMLTEVSNPDALLNMVHQPGYRRQDMWQAQIHALILKQVDVYLFSENLSEEEIRSAYLRPCPSITSLIEDLKMRYGPDLQVCVLPEGPMTIPSIA